MIKLIGTGIWICLVAFGSVYFSIQMAVKKESAEPAQPMLGGYQEIKGDIISVPVLGDGAVQGYFLTRLSYTIDPAKIAVMTIPPQELITDVLYMELVGNRVIDLGNMKTFDLTKFKSGIVAALNGRLGEQVFHDVVIEQIDFLSKEDIRSNMRQSRFTMKKGEPVGAGTAGNDAPVGDAPAASGH